MKMNTQNDTYYRIQTDLEKFPDAWAYIIVGGRNTGKTYGALSYYLKEDKTTCFIKRTNDDVDTLSAGNSLGKKSAEYEVDLSPYKAINRDLGTTIKAYKIKTGLGAFYRTVDNNAAGSPISYLCSLNAVHKIKGFDMSDAEAMIFDEFIPQPWERINRREGEQLMELYKTISRDRVLRGRKELKLICLANAVAVWNPTCEILELTDTIADMNIRGKEYFYDEEKRILVHILKTSNTMKSAEEQTGIYKALKDTQWGRMAFGNEFGYNDFSRVGKVALKGYRPICRIDYKMKSWYVYVNEENFYISKAPQKCPVVYNLDEEMGARLFYYDMAIDILGAATEGRAMFETYSMYDLIVNYKSRFKV